MNEHEQLEQTIAALESQRASLGDAVIEVALAPLRAKLHLLRSQASPSESRRRQVTVLFADVSGFTAMSEKLDAEEVTEIMNALWEQLDRAITTHRGRIDKHIGDAVMAIWGVELIQEDDPENAIRAALAMQAALADFRCARSVQLAMRIGVNTGPALLGEVGSTHEFTAMGDTVNLASRLEHAAPVGGILISHDTYRHIRGVFEVQSQAPLAVKGKAEPVRAYLVQRAKPRSFRMDRRGLEGLETRMVGRETELHALQDAYTQAVQNARTHFVTVTGEAGLGKSRLLYEFEHWLELRPESFTFFKGRVIPAWQQTPYGLFRDLFAARFDILESDSAVAAQEKFRAGMAGRLSLEQADLVGHWIGFDFSGSPAVQNLTGSPEFGRLAKSYLTNYVRELTASQPVVMFLEDLHWADSSSLELLEHLVASLPRAQWLLVGLARPTLFERRPDWGADQPAFSRLDLTLLSRTAGQALVDDILQRVEALPGTLRELIVERAEGNPYYVEELIKMLIEDGVIERGPETWLVHLARLDEVLVPPTLTGLLQARLDSLPGHEREHLQRAAVIGRLFWDSAIADLTEPERAQVSQVGAALDALQARELIFGQARSSFAGTEEYLFKHALLRDVTYETVLLKLRRSYHAQVAHWLETHAGERIGEYAGLIADHLERAGQHEEAARYLKRLGIKAFEGGEFREALKVFERAIKLLPEDSRERVGLAIQTGKTLGWLDEHEKARQQLEVALALAQQYQDEENVAAALNTLGSIALERGDFSRARSCLEESLTRARKTNDRKQTASTLSVLAWVDIGEGHLDEAHIRLLESRTVYEEVGDCNDLADVLNGLGTVAFNLGEYDRAQSLYLECLSLYRETGYLPNQAVMLNNLGETARLQQDFQLAKHYYQAALQIIKDVGSQTSVAIGIGNLGHVALASGDYAAAQSYYREALQITINVQAISRVLDNLAGWAGVLSRTGFPDRALELLGLVSIHPSLDSDARSTVEQNLDYLRTQYSPEEIEAGLERGKTLHLETVLAELLKEEARNASGF